MKVVTAKQMQALDKFAIEEIGIPGVVLMENAGRQVVAKMLHFFPNLRNQRVNIICGKGNNGGDGFVVARCLWAMEVDVRLFLLAKTESLSGDAETNCQICQKLNLPVAEILSSEELKKYISLILEADIFVDAIFGTGLTPPVRGMASEVIELLNKAKKAIVSIDIPSGLSADSAHPHGPHITASLTVTFALPKVAHVLPPACLEVGQLEIVDIGIPKEVIEQGDIKVEMIEQAFIRECLPARSPDTHKGTYGHLFILAGSPGKTGAAYLTAQAAARVGAGLITLGIPESLNSIMEGKLTEGMTIPLPETDVHTFSIKAKKTIAQLLPRFSALAVGPGISTHPEVKELILWIIQQAEIPIILDADGINALAGQAHVLKEAKQPIILTPHPKELSRLLEIDMPSILQNRLAVARKSAIDLHCHLLLKGYRSLAADPAGRVFINPTGNAGMAAGGTGDVLTGIIGGLLAQGFSPTKALQAGAYIHGLVGDKVREQKGEYGLLATDLIDNLPVTINQL